MDQTTEAKISLFSNGDSYTLYKGSMLDMLEVISPDSIDSIITDPPYELNFMGKSWDSSGIAFQPSTWEKCFTALKPGGYLLAFGGSRTFHRIACAIEDAGFEIRDTIMWLYGSGFPKSMNIGIAIDKKNGVESAVIGQGRGGVSSRAFQSEDTTTAGEYTIKQAQNEWDGWGTALKPAYEPVIVARKPFSGSCVDNVLKYGVGGINIDECRVPCDDLDQLQKNWTDRTAPAGFNGDRTGIYGSGRFEDFDDYTPSGRFPSNVILTYDNSDASEVCGGMPDSDGGVRKPTGGTILNPTSGWNNNSMVDKTTRGFDDSGSTSRYFYCAKASKRDRDEGLEQFETHLTGDLQGGRKEGSAGSIMQNADGGSRLNPYAGTGAPKKNIHPTVKPTDLMQYLVRLVTPKGGVVLDPFNGSGSTGKAVMWENRDRDANYKYIGIELTPEYLPISDARIKYAMTAIEVKEDTAKQKISSKQMNLFELPQ